MSNFAVEPSEELAYWTGVAQSDGCLTSYVVKNNRYKTGKETRIEISLDVCSKSLPMLEKFKNLSNIIFHRNCNVWKTSRRSLRFHMGVKSLLLLFKKLDIDLTSSLFIPPIWTLKEPKCFGAYLAGIIDGDGSITIKRPKYPQCSITIYSGFWQDVLSTSITKILGCSAYQSKVHRISFSKNLNRSIEGTTYKLTFYASTKTSKFMLKFVIPHLQVNYKKKNLNEFIVKRYAISPS